MTSTGETNSKSTHGIVQLGGDTSRVEMIEEIATLSKIPEIKEHFSQALLKAKKIFKNKIREFYRLNDNTEGEPSKDKPEKMKGEVVHELSKAFEKSKTYFFELTRIDEPGTESGFRWELGKFKLKTKDDGKFVDLIFNDFIEKVDQYKVTPQQIKDEIVEVPSLDKKFQISFTKSSPTRVVGFVKEAKSTEEKPGEKGKEEAEDKFVIKRNKNMLKLNSGRTKTLKMNKKELEELFETNPEYTDNLIFYIETKRAFDHPEK
jgi:hypothetical protein